MKTVIKLTFLLLLVTNLVDGQNNTKSFISLSGGISNPLGNFANSDASSFISGFALTGTNFSFDGAWYFHPNIGIGGVINSSSYGLNVNALAAGYLADFDCDSAKAKANPYHTLSFLIGPHFSLPLNKLTIEARILGGITTTTTPDIIGTAINERDGTANEGSISTFVQTSATTNAFGFQAGLGLRYAISGHFLMSLRSDYFYSKPMFSFDNIGRTNVSGRVLNAYNEPIAGINATLGVGYQF